jgi:hypothetical protein
MYITLALQIVVNTPETTIAKGELTIIIGCHARPYNESPNKRHGHRDLSQQNSRDDLTRRPSTTGRNHNNGGGGGGRKMESHGKYIIKAITLIFVN